MENNHFIDCTFGGFKSGVSASDAEQICRMVIELASTCTINPQSLLWALEPVSILVPPNSPHSPHSKQPHAVK